MWLLSVREVRLESTEMVFLFLSPARIILVTLWSSYANHQARHINAIKRSRAHLGWMYYLHPENSYLMWVARENDTVIGYAVARHQHTEDLHVGLIADIFGFSDRRDVLVALVSNVVSYFVEDGHHEWSRVESNLLI